MVNYIKPCHDATPTWSGFTHQGKVAILVVLDLFLEEENNCLLESDFYEMELEWMEDIAIKKQGNYLSIHQVKAYQNGNISSYGDAIWMLLGKCHLEKIPNSYLHTVTSVDLDKEKIKNVTLKESNEAYRSSVNKEANFEEVFSSLNAYEYTDGKGYCELEYIDELICEKISNIVDLEGCVQKTEKQISITYLHLLELIHHYITKRHIEIQKGEYKQNDQDRTNILTISFNEIKKIIFTNYEESSEEYYCLELRKLFSYYTDDFLTHVIEEKSFEEDVIVSFKDAISQLTVLSDEDFIMFCKRLSPHEGGQGLNIDTYHSLLPIDGVHESFFEILISLDSPFTNEKDGIKYEINKKIYIPSAINTGITQARRTARGILGNGSMLDELFLIDTIISKRMNVDSIGNYGEKVHEISIEDIDGTSKHEEHEKFTKIKKIRIIDLEKTKEELNI